MIKGLHPNWERLNPVNRVALKKVANEPSVSSTERSFLSKDIISARGNASGRGSSVHEQMIKNKTHSVFHNPQANEQPSVPMLNMNDSISTHRSKEGGTERVQANTTAPRKVEKSLLTKQHMSTDDHLVMDWHIGRKND